MGLQQRWLRTQRFEKILREMNESKLEAQGSDFLEKKWCEEEENASG